MFSSLRSRISHYANFKCDAETMCLLFPNRHWQQEILSIVWEHTEGVGTYVCALHARVAVSETFMVKMQEQSGDCLTRSCDLHLIMESHHSWNEQEKRNHFVLYVLVDFTVGSEIIQDLYDFTMHS